MDMYLDIGNGTVTTRPYPGNALITDSGDDYLYIETYELYGGSRLSIAYTEEGKRILGAEHYRREVCKEHCVEFSELRRLIRIAIPSNKYKALSFYFKRSEEKEEE